ncbi:bifunctional chorismate mutase/prephenate dehydrogenase, partial [mine drainage metagenome]
MNDPELQRLRARMAEADASLLRAVHHRMEVARAIGERKSREGLALRDFRTEGEVLERWRRGLAPLNIPPERAEALARWLVEESVRVQERMGEPNRPPSVPSDIVVAGGLGQMGGWMREFFRAEGH